MPFQLQSYEYIETYSNNRKLVDKCTAALSKNVLSGFLSFTGVFGNQQQI